MNRGQDVADSLRRLQQATAGGGDSAATTATPAQQLGFGLTADGAVTVAQLQHTPATHQQQQSQQLLQPAQQIVLQNVTMQPSTSTAQLLGVYPVQSCTMSVLCNIKAN